MDIAKSSVQVKVLVAFITFYISLGFGAGITTFDNTLGTSLVPLNLAQIGSLSTTSTEVTPTIKIISPNGGESFSPGDKITISYQATGLDNVRIVVRKNNLALTTLAQSTANTGSYTWTIPTNQALGSDYKIRVRDALAGGTPKYFDDSDATFTIVAKVVTPVATSTPTTPAPTPAPVIKATTTTEFPVAKAVLATPIPVTHLGVGKVASAKPGIVSNIGQQQCAIQGVAGSKGLCCMGKGVPTTGGYCPGFVPGITPKPAMAIDGNVAATSLWCSADQVEPNKGVAPDNWLTIDLLAPTPIGSTKITFANGTEVGGLYACTRATDYLIQTSNDKITWTTQATVTGNTKDVVEHTLTNTPNARYIRIFATKVLLNQGYRLGVREFEVYEGIPTTPDVAVNSITPSTLVYNSSGQTIALNGTGFTAGNEITVDDVTLPGLIAAVNASKLNFSLPNWIWPGSHKLVIENENGWSEKTFTVAKPAGGYLLARGANKVSFVSQPFYPGSVAKKSGPSRWLASVKKFLVAAAGLITNTAQESIPGSAYVVIDDGDSVDLKWDFPDDTYTSCYRGSGGRYIPITGSSSPSVFVGDPDFESEVSYFGSAELQYFPGPPAKQYYGPYTANSLENLNEGSYTTGPIKRPIEIDSTATTSITFVVWCAKAQANDPTKAEATQDLSDPYHSWDVKWAYYSLEVDIKPTPFTRCENKYQEIEKELFDGPFPVEITEDGFRDWANVSQGSITFPPSNVNSYDASGGYENLRDGIVALHPFCSTVRIDKIDNEAFEYLKTQINKGLPQHISLALFEAFGENNLLLEDTGHAVIALAVSEGVADNGEEFYDVTVLDPNGPGVVVLKFINTRVSIYKRLSESVVRGGYFYVADYQNSKAILVLGKPVPSVHPRDTAFCKKESNRDTEYCKRNLSEWLKNNYPNIDNPSENGGGNCAGWAEFVLMVAYKGNFTSECPAPRL